MDIVQVRKKVIQKNCCCGGSSAALMALLALGSVQQAQAAQYVIPSTGDAVVGADQEVETVYEDTLYDLARTYGLGSEELIRVNPDLDPWLPGAGKKVIVPGRHILPPGPREGIVVNLPEHRLYYYPKPKRNGPRLVITYPVSIGKMDWRTPLGLTHVMAKQKDPTWYPPESVRKEHAQGRRSAAFERAAGPRESARSLCAAPGGGKGNLSDSRHE